jgi:hypothetical protein
MCLLRSHYPDFSSCPKQDLKIMNLIKHRSIQFAMGAGAIAVSAISGLSSPNVASAVTITYENPNIFSASASVGTTKQVDFESATLGNTPNYTVNFVDSASGHDYVATYDLLKVTNYGSGSQTAGAGYSGQFATNIDDGANKVLTTNLTFADTTAGNNAAGIEYFGLFYSSLDANNQLTFYDGSTILAQFTFQNIPQLLNNTPGFVGGPYTQEGVFFNFYADAGEKFTKIQFSQLGGGGFESDNHTFRVPEALAISGTGVNPAGLKVTAGTLNTTSVPEPFTIVGTIIGGTAALRMRKKLKAD